MGRFYFVRHGQTVWNVENKICGASDSPLTDLGHAQARETGRILKEKIDVGNIHIDGILTSPLSRAYDTAEEISKLINVQFRLNGVILQAKYNLKCSEADYGIS